jgi:hypothetical protein
MNEEPWHDKVGGESVLERARSQAPVDTSEFIAHQDAMYDRLQRVAEVERQICALQAAQLEEIAGYIKDRLSYDERAGCSSGPGQHRGMVAEVAIARHVSVITAESLMADAYLLTTQNPSTLQALRRGSLGLPAARVIANETALLDTPEQVLAADRLIAAEAVDVLPGKVRALAERRVASIDPAAAARRRRREKAERHVRLNHAGSGMSYLDAYLPAEQGVVCIESLRQSALRARAGGDERSLGQVMSDTLVARLTGLEQEAVVPVHVNVVMTDKALLGLDDSPAHLYGGGPLPAPVARDLATGESAWLRRIVTDPVDGSVSQIDARRRRFDGLERELVILRDQHCQGIQCASPIRDVDHIIEYCEGGHTVASNGQGLSKNCHVARDDPRMRVSRDPDTAVVRWETSTGLVYRNLPPPALGSGTGDTRQLQLRHFLLHPPDSGSEQRLVKILVRHLRRVAGPEPPT